MKTTIELPDETFRRVKVAAAASDTTLKELITKAVERFLDASAVEDITESRSKVLKRLLSEMQASNREPIQPFRREDIYER